MMSARTSNERTLMAATSNTHSHNPPLECASLSLVHNWLQQSLNTTERTSSTETPTASTDVLADLTPQNVINIKPFALCLANLLPPQAASSIKRSLVDGYIQELQLKACDYNRRQVTMLHWHNPLAYMDKAEITEIMYHLGRSYHLSDHQQADYCVRLNNDSQKEDIAALFKGLGFNRLEVLEAPQSSTSTNELRNLRALADDYQYQQFQLTLEAPCFNLHTRLQQAFKDVDQMPDIVRFHSLNTHHATRLRATEFHQLLQGMRAKGYRILGNDCFVKAKHELASAQNQQQLSQTWLGYNAANVTSVLGIGPGNISQEDWHYDRNPCTLEHYLNRPEQHLFERPTPKGELRAKLMTDALLRYHSLDLKYLADRYDLHPLKLLEQYQHHLTHPRQALFDTDARYCQLTLLGVAYLEEICHLFMLYTPANS